MRYLSVFGRVCSSLSLSFKCRSSVVLAWIPLRIFLRMFARMVPNAQPKTRIRKAEVRLMVVNE